MNTYFIITIIQVPDGNRIIKILCINRVNGKGQNIPLVLPLFYFLPCYV